MYRNKKLKITQNLSPYIPDLKDEVLRRLLINYEMVLYQYQIGTTGVEKVDAYNPKMLAENAASEVSFAQVVRAQFASGAGVCTISDEMPDAAIILAIRQGLAAGKPFTVIPINTA